jgi:hypothetical protein
MEVLMNGKNTAGRVLSENRLGIAFGLSLLLVSAAFAQTPPPAAKPAAGQKNAPAKPAASGAKGEFFIHAFHKEKLGTLECNSCHTPVADGSVELKRPGHDQCKVCHADDFDKEIKPTICAQCHSEFPPGGASDLRPFPRYKNTRAILFQFSHASHVDKKARVNLATGYRADCTFCHKFDAQGIFGKFPGHTECAACHSRPGMKPALTASLDTAGCRGCHTPEEIENPGFTENRRMVTKVAVSGKYVDIKFSHSAHFKVKEAFGLNCTTCHYAIPKSTSLADLTLPKMLDCVECHDTSKSIAAQFRMSNCTTCHADTVQGIASPASHNRNVKPAFHTDSFRIRHEHEASEPDAKCFVCHQNVAPSVEAKSQCTSCHVVMLPASHTSRWKDDIHGKYAALDRTACATCHAADYCSRCHNEVPRSHQPLPIFKGGGHAFVAMLDQRACFTCHTFQDTCAQCHAQGVGSKAAKRPGN